MTPRSVSIVINTLNRLTTLPNTLRAIESLRWPKFEVVVVNGPSDDGTDVHLELFWKDKVRIVHCPVQNLSVSRNIGLRNAGGEIVAFLDDDAVPEPDWLDHLMQPYDDPLVGAVGGWVRDRGGVSFQTKHIRSQRVGTSQVKLDEPANCDDTSFVGLIGVNSSIRKEVARQIGGFDEWFAYFLDETDLVLRVQEAGYKVIIVPEAEVHHKYAPSHIRPADQSKVTIAQTALSLAYFNMRHGPTSQATLAEKFEATAAAERRLIKNVDWKLKAGDVDTSTATRLQNEIAANVSQGIAAYFEGPQLLQPCERPTPFVPTISRPSKKRLRLAFVTETFFPRQLGGIAVFVSELARELALDGHEITIVTRAERGSGHSVEYEDGVWVHRLPYEAHEADAPDGFPSLPTKPARFALQVLAELDRINGHRDFAAVIGTIWNLDLAAVIASRRYRVGMYLVTSYLLLEASKPEWRENKDYYENHVLKMANGERWALGSVDRIYTSTGAILDDICSTYSLKADQVAPTVRIPFGLPDYASPGVGKTDGRVIITFVGRLEHRKGIDLLLEAIPPLLTKHLEVDVRIVGEDHKIPGLDETYGANFRERHANEPWMERVALTGYLDEEGLRAEFDTCDIFVAPSRYESFGLIYVEAMRASKPSVAIAVGGVPEVVQNGVTGILVEPNPSAIEGALSKLVADSGLRQSMGRAARKRFEENFSMRTFSRAFADDTALWLGASLST